MIRILLVERNKYTNSYEHTYTLNNNKDTIKLGFYSIKKYVEIVKYKLKQAC